MDITLNLFDTHVIILTIFLLILAFIYTKELIETLSYALFFNYKKEMKKAWDEFNEDLIKQRMKMLAVTMNIFIKDDKIRDSNSNKNHIAYMYLVSKVASSQYIYKANKLCARRVKIKEINEEKEAAKIENFITLDNIAEQYAMLAIAGNIKICSFEEHVNGDVAELIFKAKEKNNKEQKKDVKND